MDVPPTSAILRLASWTLLLCVASANYAGEEVSQAVQIKIYDTSVGEWTSSSLKDYVKSEATPYCLSHLAACNLLSATSFSSSEVVASGPSKEGSSVLVSIYILFPSGSSVDPNGTTQFVLPATVTQEILSNVRNDYHEGAGLWMTYIGSEYYSIPPNAEANRLVIPLAFLAVGAAGIATAILKHKEVLEIKAGRERKEKRDKLKQKMAAKKARQSTVPNYNINNNVLETTNTTVLSNTPRSPRKTVNKNAAWNLDASVTTVSKSISLAQYPTASVNHFHDEPIYIKKNGLKPLNHGPEVVPAMSDDVEVVRKPPPLDAKANVDEVESAEKKERRRRRKEKKREKRRLQELEMYDNQAVESSNASEQDVERSRTNVQTFSVERDTEA